MQRRKCPVKDHQENLHAHLMQLSFLALILQFLLMIIIIKLILLKIRVRTVKFQIYE
jgi:hypothetical protein